MFIASDCIDINKMVVTSTLGCIKYMETRKMLTVRHDKETTLCLFRFSDILLEQTNHVTKPQYFSA